MPEQRDASTAAMNTGSNRYPISDYKQMWQSAIGSALNSHPALSADNTDGVESAIDTSAIHLAYTLSCEHGELTLPLFRFSKQLKQSPQSIAEHVITFIDNNYDRDTYGRAVFLNGYLNIYLPRQRCISQLLSCVHTQGADYGKNSTLHNQKIMIEYSSPNSNKPLHLGHLRNNILGQSLSCILAGCGAEVKRVNLVNDRGIHICQAMAAYKLFGNNSAPEKKSDHFVGDYYVRYAQWEKEDADKAKALTREMLRLWESGDEETRALWLRMRTWVLDGIKKTYERTGIRFDITQYESDVYQFGKKLITEGLERGVFTTASDGSVEIDLSSIGLDVKKLLRSDGTSIYLTQDLGTASKRYEVWPFDELIYVVASEQEYHFKVLFEVLKRLDMPFAARLYHCSYGMVKLPHGNMKSREGTVVDADWLIDILHEKIAAEIAARNTDGGDADSADIAERAEKMAVASLHYWLLKTESRRDTLFDINESIAFNGHSGLYILYVLTRIKSILRKADYTPPGQSDGGDIWDSVSKNLENPLEWELVVCISRYPDTLAEAAGARDPHPLSAYLFRLAKLFTRYYHDTSIAVEKSEQLRHARLHLAAATASVIENCCDLLVMPTVTRM